MPKEKVYWSSHAGENGGTFSYKDYLTYSRLGCSRRHLKGSKYEPMREDRLTSRLFHKFQIANRTREGAHHHFGYDPSPKTKSVESEMGESSTGGIFNLAFNTSGSVLAAACEAKTALLIDPGTRRTVADIGPNAHTQPVNCIRFLDERVFATCSDDTSVAIWDARFLKSKVKTFQGHTNCVKNIEYSPRDQRLVTSGFDGSVLSWDLNRSYDATVTTSSGSEDEAEIRLREMKETKVFYTNGLMRMRMTQACDKMVISTMNSYMMIIHDLNLQTLAQDLKDFKPNMYRLMQISGKPLAAAVTHTKLFHAKRNRVEIIDDFPEKNEAEAISSLLLHPKGWVTVSRNVSADDNSEWCCVHDLHSYPAGSESEDEGIDSESRTFKQAEAERRARRQQMAATRQRSSPLTGIDQLAEFVIGPSGGGGSSMDDSSEQRPSSSSENREQNEPDGADRTGGSSDNDSTSDDDEDIGEGAEDRDEPMVLNSNSRAVDLFSLFSHIVRSARGSGGGPAEAPSLGQNEASRSRNGSIDGPSTSEEDPRVRHPANEPGGENHENNARNVGEEGPEESADQPAAAQQRRRYQGFLLLPSLEPGGNASVMYFGPPGGGGGPNIPAAAAGEHQVPEDAKLHHNKPRLTHYLEESNQGRGFIKEICFSGDGRVIGSPYGFGIRLLAFDGQCRDLSESASDLYIDNRSSSVVDYYPARSRPLHEVTCLAGFHDDVVLSSAFSPHGYTLVTGCRSGKIAWHQPVL